MHLVLGRFLSSIRFRSSMSKQSAVAKVRSRETANQYGLLDKDWFELMLNDSMTPYFLGATAWIFAWWLQMGPFRPFLNFVPGIELPFFPAGIRTLAVLIFGFSGAAGIFIGSLVTYFLYFPELMTASPLSVTVCAAASAFSSYLTMRLVCDLRKIPSSLAGLTLGNISWIVVTQSLLSATLHQFIYHSEIISPIYDNTNISATLFNWSAMVTGDALGSMTVLLTLLIGFQLFTKSQNQ